MINTAKVTEIILIVVVTVVVIFVLVSSCYPVTATYEEWGINFVTVGD